jgi:hypothetical protein
VALYASGTPDDFRLCDRCGRLLAAGKSRTCAQCLVPREAPARKRFETGWSAAIVLALTLLLLGLYVYENVLLRGASLH